MTYTKNYNTYTSADEKYNIVKEGPKNWAVYTNEINKYGFITTMPSLKAAKWAVEIHREDNGEYFQSQKYS